MFFMNFEERICPLRSLQRPPAQVLPWLLLAPERGPVSEFPHHVAILIQWSVIVHCDSMNSQSLCCELWKDKDKAVWTSSLPPSPVECLHTVFKFHLWELPWWPSGKESACQCRRHWVWSLIREDPTCHRATKPMSHNYWACALEARSHDYWTHLPQRLKPSSPRARVLQQEKPPQWEAQAPQ